MSSSKIPIVYYKITSISRIYTYYNQYFYTNGENDIKAYELKYGNVNKYRLVSIIGSGKYSLVFAGHCSQGFCAVKVLKNVAFQKIQKELYILERVSLCSNVVHVYDVIRDHLTGTISIVTEFFNSDPTRHLYSRLTLDEVMYYMYLLLQTLDTCHSRGVMHRDIKPGNVLINNKTNRLKVIDWGLADLYYPMKQYTVRVSTMRYKAPELLLGYHFYDYGVDIWGAGCILAEMLFGVGFIKGNLYEEVMESIAKLWGNSVVYEYADKYGFEIPELFESGLERAGSDETWDEITNKLREGMNDSNLLDLLKKLLTVDHGERITAREAMKHPFFSSIY